jgi:hypothetical protein
MLVNKQPDTLSFSEGITITNGDIAVRVFTGNIKPPSEDLPTVPAGSLYLYAGTDGSTIYQHDGTDWIVGNFGQTGSASGWNIFAPDNRPIFLINNVEKDHDLLEDKLDGYFLIVKRIMSIEFDGVSGHAYEWDSKKKIKGIDTDGKKDDGGDTDKFPGVWTFMPGYYRVDTDRAGTLTMQVHGYSGSEVSFPDFEWDAEHTEINDVFTWFPLPQNPWTV